MGVIRIGIALKAGTLDFGSWCHSGTSGLVSGKYAPQQPAGILYSTTRNPLTRRVTPSSSAVDQFNTSHTPISAAMSPPGWT